MFDVLLESNRPRLAAGGSFVLSTIAHLAVAGAVVVGTRLPPSDAPIPENFISRALYVPPPDRRPAASATAERLQYVTLGIPLGNLPGLTDGPIGASEFGRPTPELANGSVLGEAEFASVALPALAGTDSAYSVLDVDSTVQRFADSDAPLYPPVLLAQAVEGMVLMRYVVDTLGRADMRTTEVLLSSHPQFTQAVMQALPGMRFRPAMIASRRVRQLVEQEFAFRIQRPDVAAALPDSAGSTVP